MEKSVVAGSRPTSSHARTTRSRISPNSRGWSIQALLYSSAKRAAGTAEPRLLTGIGDGTPVCPGDAFLTDDRECDLHHSRPSVGEQDPDCAVAVEEAPFVTPPA
jgi:hypothetical protein